MSEPILAWHFVGKTLRDGRPVPADGEVLRHHGPLIMCVSGLHASERLIDALTYAPGSILCRVACGGGIDSSEDVLVCYERTILWRLDAADILRAFTRECALAVARAAGAAGAAAMAVAWATAMPYAGNAGNNTAALAAAYAKVAAYDAAEATTGSGAAKLAARLAAREAQNARLTALVEAVHASA